MFLYWLAILMLYAGELLAVQGGPELDRSLVSMYGEGQGEVWGQFDYVDRSFAESFGYGSSTSGLNYSQSSRLGGKYGMTDRINLRAQYGQHEDEVWRSTEPKITRSQYDAVEAVLQNVFYIGSDFDLAWSAGYRSHKASRGDIKSFQFGSYLIQSGNSAIVVDGLASLGYQQLGLTLSGKEHTIVPVGEGSIQVDSSYTMSQLESGRFDLSVNGKTSAVVDNGGSLTVTTPGSSMATVSPFAAEGHTGVVKLETEVAGGLTTVYLESIADGINVYLDSSLTNPATITDDVVPGTDVSTDDIRALLEVENSFGLLTLPKLANEITRLNHVLRSINTTYIVNAEPSDRAWQVGLTGSWYPSRELRFSLGGDLRQVYIEPSYKLNPAIHELLTVYDAVGIDNRGKEALDLIDAQLPQEKGWDETHLLLTAGADWDAYADLSFAAQYTFYTISRNGYQSAVGKVNKEVEDQTVNHQFDGWLFVKPTPDLTFYLHGRAYSNFLLGDRPLLYNARVNHKFTDPYGFVSAGVVWEF